MKENKERKIADRSQGRVIVKLQRNVSASALESKGETKRQRKVKEIESPKTALELCLKDQNYASAKATENKGEMRR